VIPVARVTSPPLWTLLFGVLVQPVTRLQQTNILATVALCRRDVLDAAVAMFHVVPTHELAGPLPCSIKVCKALCRELNRPGDPRRL